uniref:Family with sequence similarity 186, member A n=1 Tax=Mustela putorius furo TaxID=9669 RepID=M3YBE1_MUSPF
INMQLADIMLNVQRIINRYTLDENVHSGRKISITEYKKRRVNFMEKIVTCAKNVEIREKTLVYILAWLEEWRITLEYKKGNKRRDKREKQVRVLEDIGNIFDSIYPLQDIFFKIGGNPFKGLTFVCSFLTLLKESRLTSRSTLWKSWKERVIKRPATAHALRPDQMISDKFATNTKVSEIQDMLQELINTMMFNKLENNAIKYISSTIINLSKALGLINDELKIFNLQSANMYISETSEKEKELSLKIMRELSEKNEMLQQKLQEAEEKYEQFIRFKIVVEPQVDKSKSSTESRKPRSEHVPADYPSTDTKSQVGRNGTSGLWEQLRKLKPEYSHYKSQISSESKEESTTESMDKESKSETSSQAEQFGSTQLEKIDNVGKPLDKKTVPKEELLKTPEAEKLGIIREKIEEYFQSVGETVTKTLRKYKDIKSAGQKLQEEESWLQRKGGKQGQRKQWQKMWKEQQKQSMQKQTEQDEEQTQREEEDYQKPKQQQLEAWDKKMEKQMVPLEKEKGQQKGDAQKFPTLAPSGLRSFQRLKASVLPGESFTSSPRDSWTPQLPLISEAPRKPLISGVPLSSPQFSTLLAPLSPTKKSKSVPFTVTKKPKMMPPSSPQELKEQRYFVDVEAQRKNLVLLNQATKSSGLPSQLHTTARNLIIETLHTDTVRLGYLFRKYIAYRLIQRARNNIIRRLQALQNTGKGYETQNLFILLNRIDDYQKKIMQVWTNKQKSLEQKRNQCLRKMMFLFSQLQEMYKLNLSRPIPLITDKKEIPVSAKFVQQPFLELLIEEDRKQEDQMRAIWNADLSTSSYPIAEKTSIHSLWAQLGGYPDIPMLLQLDVQSTFRKSLASVKSQFKKIPK